MARVRTLSVTFNSGNDYGGPGGEGACVDESRLISAPALLVKLTAEPGGEGVHLVAAKQRKYCAALAAAHHARAEDARLLSGRGDEFLDVRVADLVKGC